MKTDLLTTRDFLIQLYRHYDLGKKEDFESALRYLEEFIKRKIPEYIKPLGDLHS
jgi:hypothetical protein